MDIGTPRCRVAVDSLFVFVAQDYIASRGFFKETGQTLQHTVPQGSGNGKTGMIEAEDPHPPDAEDVGQFKKMPEYVEVGSKIIGHSDLSHRRTDRPHRNTRPVKLFSDCFCFCRGKLGNVLSVNGAYL